MVFLGNAVFACSPKSDLRIRREGLCMMGQELPPRLLAEVESMDQARSALAGGADLLSWKVSPSMGVAETSVADSLASLDDFQAAFPGQKVCLDLGELFDPTTKGHRTPGTIPDCVRWVRLGLTRSQERPGWLSEWRDLRNRMLNISRRPCAWLAVAYVDHELVGAPSPEAMLELAVSERCAALWLTTYSTFSQSWTDHFAPHALLRLIERARRLRLPVFLSADGVADDLDWLCDLEPFVVSLRPAGTRFGVAGPGWVTRSVRGCQRAIDAACGFDRTMWSRHQRQSRHGFAIR